MVKEHSFGFLAVRCRQLKGKLRYGEHKILEKIDLSIKRYNGNSSKTVGRLTSIPIISLMGSNSHIPSECRARAWKELAGLIKVSLLFKDPVVKEGQYQNRLQWESWERSLRKRPTKSDLYDWRKDNQVLSRLRPRYERLGQKLSRVIGAPTRDDLEALHPNEFDDLGLSEESRRIVQDLKAIFTEDITGEL